jgi:uncharacterized membrane protein YcaP (DUF421 family)
MKKEEIHWADWHRIFLGTAPMEFLLEALIRTIIMYLILLIVLRLLGKRMGGQLTISELAVMLTLGAIIAVPMQVPEKGILQGILVLFCALVFQRGVNYLGLKSRKMERFIQGGEELLIKDGVMVIDQLRKMKISREQMAAELRSKGIFNLGEVSRVYIEACGLFSIYKMEKAKPGLELNPPEDKAAATEFNLSSGVFVCWQCGNAANQLTGTVHACSNCGASEWTAAVTSK